MVAQNRVEVTLWFALDPMDSIFMEHQKIPFALFHELEFLEITLQESLQKYRKVRAVLRLGQDTHDLSSHPPISSSPIATMWDECIIPEDDDDTMLDRLRVTIEYHDNYRNRDIDSINTNQTSVVDDPNDELIHFYIESIKQSIDSARMNISRLSPVELTWKGYSGLQFRY